MTQRYQLTGALAATALLLLVGCSSPPTAQQVHAAKAQRIQAEKLLMRFEKAIREDRPEAALALLASDMSSLEKSLYSTQIKQAVLLEHYDGYELAIAEAFDDVDLKSWLRGHARVKVRATNRHGARFREEFTLGRRSEHGWRIVSLELEEPIEGEAARLDKAEEEQVREFLEQFTGWLKEEKYGRIIYSFPEKERVRVVRPGFFGKLIGRSAYPLSLTDDLMFVDQLAFVEWPEVPQRLPLEFITDKDVAVRLVGRYRLPQGETAEVKPIVFAISFTEADGKWEPHRLRIECEDLPQ